MKMPFQLIRRKIVLKTLLIQKAVVTLLIRSFFNNGGLFANCTYTISCYIIAVQEVVALKEQKYHLYLSDDEYRQTIQSLVRLKNNLISQGRSRIHYFVPNAIIAVPDPLSIVLINDM